MPVTVRRAELADAAELSRIAAITFPLACPPAIADTASAPTVVPSATPSVSSAVPTTISIAAPTAGAAAAAVIASASPIRAHP